LDIRGGGGVTATVFGESTGVGAEGRGAIRDAEANRQSPALPAQLRVSDGADEPVRTFLGQTPAGSASVPPPWMTEQEVAVSIPRWSTPSAGRLDVPRAVPREFGRGRVVDAVWLRAASLRPGCPLVVVSSADGGVGRSTLVAALGGVVALACPAPVVAVDVSGRAWGGLVHRVGGPGVGSVWDAVQAGERLRDRCVLERCVRRSATGLHVLVGEVEMTSARRPPTNEETSVLIGRPREMYALALLDAAAADTAATWRMLSRASVPVLVARASVDSLQHTMRLLGQLRAVGLDAVADRSVVVVMASTATVARAVRAGEYQASSVAGAVVRVPFDAGLARPEPVDPRSLRRATRGALVEVAAAVLALCPTDLQTAAASRGNTAETTTGQDTTAKNRTVPTTTVKNATRPDTTRQDARGQDTSGPHTTGEGTTQCA
jgi:MinD-like ATPase involved in chromosome partitioning or flagellar assembly